MAEVSPPQGCFHFRSDLGGGENCIWHGWPDRKLIDLKIVSPLSSRHLKKPAGSAKRSDSERPSATAAGEAPSLAVLNHLPVTQSSSRKVYFSVMLMGSYESVALIIHFG